MRVRVTQVGREKRHQGVDLRRMPQIAVYSMEQDRLCTARAHRTQIGFATLAQEFNGGG